MSYGNLTRFCEDKLCEALAQTSLRQTRRQTHQEILRSEIIAPVANLFSDGNLDFFLRRSKVLGNWIMVEKIAGYLASQDGSSQHSDLENYLKTVRPSFARSLTAKYLKIFAREQLPPECCDANVLQFIGYENRWKFICHVETIRRERAFKTTWRSATVLTGLTGEIFYQS